MGTADSGYELLFVAAKRNVMAVDPYTGQVVWDRRLPKMGGSYVTLYNTAHTLFASRSNGFVYALEKMTGEIIWEKQIKEFRGAPISMALSTQVSGSDIFSSAAAADAAAAAAAVAAG